MGKLKATIPGAHRGLKKKKKKHDFPPTGVEILITHRMSDRVLRKLLTQVGGKISLRLNSALLLPNKT